MRPAARFAKRLAIKLVVVLAALALVAYLVLPERPARRLGPFASAPAEAADNIKVLGLSNARFWAWFDTQGEAFLEEWEQSLARERASSQDGTLPTGHFLAISGGGGDGAFGAGVICGWAEDGTLPAFKLVTGISTGSMIAPFAFLGGPYIDRLRKMYTSISPADIQTLRALNGLFGIAFGEALADTAPLYKLISRYVDEQMLADIAAAYKTGRLLMIATASLDQQRPVLWNIGAIAASGHPRAVELVRKLILASAAIPGAFPPVMIDIEADGVPYAEMNVDAGVVSQAFLYPIHFSLRTKHWTGKFARHERHAYVIRNSRLDPDWTSVERDFLTIVERSIATMIHYLGYNDVMRIYETVKDDGFDYNLAFIEPDFNKKKREPFDPEYLRALFDYALEKSRGGYRWHKEPPILKTMELLRAEPP
jgi:hypothetical protein